MFNVQRVLVPVDYSDCSIRALRFALGLARQSDAEAEALHVFRPPSGILGFFPPTARRDSSVRGRHCQDEAHERALEELAALLRREATFSSASANAVVACGSPTEEILSRSRSGRYDLIIMGTHGRTGLAYWLLGSVAESVVRLSPCPVLTIRPPNMPGSVRPPAPEAATEVGH